MGQFDNQTPPGFMPNRTLANRGSSNEVVIPPADSLAILAEIQGRHEASEAEKMGRANSSRQQRHLYAAQLAWETSHLIRDAQSQRDKKYSFQEWAHFLHALGRDERLPLLASEPREGLNRVDAHDVRSRAETHLEYGWLSEASPLMASSEPEWLLEKFSRLLVETVEGYTTEQHC